MLMLQVWPTQVQGSHDAILALLDEASHELRTVSFGENAAERPRVFLESDEKVEGRACVSGSLTLAECHCEDFDLSVRFAKYNKGNTLQFSTAPKSSYLLRQVQDALHMVEMASDLVAQFATSSFAICRDYTVAHGDAVERTPRTHNWLELLPLIRQVGLLCDEIAMLLHKAEKEMADWSSKALPSMPQNWLRMEPPLPADLLLQMYLDKSTLVLRVSVLTIQVPSRSSSNRLLAAPGDSAERLRGRLISHKGGWIEVLESLDVRAAVEPLRKALERIAQAKQRVVDLRQNALALESCVAQDEVACAQLAGAAADSLPGTSVA